MVTDIWNGLAQPGPIIGGVCIGLLLLTQRFSTVIPGFCCFFGLVLDHLNHQIRG
jgi:hypothetical protein